MQRIPLRFQLQHAALHHVSANHLPMFQQMLMSIYGFGNVREERMMQEIFPLAIGDMHNHFGATHPLVLKAMCIHWESYPHFWIPKSAHRIALKARTRQLGPLHAITLLAAHELGKCYLGHGRHEKAIPAYERAVKG
ncbi:hypothetical protein K470DRAFT_1708 [Piedraia hortae CBS 480.64]|uniref:Uncharacterized protein n=1 Tax=Piedraia hortae CBS 480.64 TaxID=1314780 RepID=A0A6A7CA77_9PEZI|nr:hypothetical protein K470DRAFT_1708 [Piedraia hortae CBS 480.64]